MWVPPAALVGQFQRVDGPLDLAQLRPGVTAGTGVEVATTGQETPQRVSQVLLTLFQVRPVFDGQGYQVWLEARPFSPDYFPPLQIHAERLGASADGAK